MWTAESWRDAISSVEPSRARAEQQCSLWTIDTDRLLRLASDAQRLASAASAASPLHAGVGCTGFVGGRLPNEDEQPCEVGDSDAESYR